MDPVSPGWPAFLRSEIRYWVLEVVPSGNLNPDMTNLVSKNLSIAPMNYIASIVNHFDDGPQSKQTLSPQSTGNDVAQLSVRKVVYLITVLAPGITKGNVSTLPEIPVSVFVGDTRSAKASALALFSTWENATSQGRLDWTACCASKVRRHRDTHTR
ncbi:hypothetical protein MMC20_006407 [Loxospora ochrophaea]|nr:hypothetical protein [Loxospora ochrophaea]